MAPATNEGGDRMTYEEAIKQLNSIAIYHFDKYTTDAIDMAINALEKQIPKKPIIRKTKNYFGYTEYILCPNCKKVDFGLTQPCFCRLCGQAIDWEED